MRLFIEFLKEKRYMLVLSIGFIMIYLFVFWLYQLPQEAVLYPTGICIFILLVVMSISFYSYKKRIEQLDRAKENLENLYEFLPIGKTGTENKYKTIIELIINEKLNRDIIEAKRYQQMREYYTIWVHQIKTPIAAIKLILQNEDSEESRRINREVHRVEQYVEMVLAYIKMNEKSSDYVIKECQIDDLIKQSIKSFSAEFIHKKIRLEYQPINKGVLTDEKWFVFVLEQLLSNALKYMSSGFVKIYEHDGCLSIEDSGIGITKEDLPRVFEHGYTGALGRSDKRASGIGLYLCKEICEKLNHKISITSSLGEGTVVTIDLSSYKLGVE